ncbi:DNA mismatch repair endonuclease MutL [Flavobacteriaceae bacterium Ap0902]|nr:DNA mismatch repair endonuclease MutL [Flavobacteriaceae bacterium Ap0902]
MNDVIHLLPDHVANQIAAGEVVQRPSSVVKELLENAIDAGATKIHLVVKEAGRQLIQVIDNGRGMSVKDARMAFERHATSKIRTTEDIFHILTKGFRGEALASIAAVAHVELKTRQEGIDLGTAIQINGGKIKNQEPVVTPKGTIISVSNLFYNVPARRNFLKSNAVEFRHIIDEFQRVALAHEHISFQLTHNDNDVFQLAEANLAQRVLHIFGRKLEGQLVPVGEETDVAKINGLIGKPDVAKKSRGEQFFFVNQRFVKSGYLHKAVQSAFESLISEGLHPSYFIFLTINPEKIDINIHPTKTEIKFEEEAIIYAQLRAAVKHALGQYQVTPTLDFDRPTWDVPTLNRKKEIKTPEIKVDKSYNPFKNPSGYGSSSTPKAGGSFSYYKLEEESEPIQNQIIESGINFKREVLQWHQSFLVTEFQDDLVLIDQHRAHQAVLYERFIKKTKGNSLSQQLLFPIEVHADSKEISILLETEQLWISFGFDFSFEKDLIIVNAIPADITAEMVPSVISEFLASDYREDGLKYEEILARFMAKFAAVKKGTAMSTEESKHLVQQLFELEQFNYTPFGKKIYRKIDLAETLRMLD